MQSVMFRLPFDGVGVDVSVFDFLQVRPGMDLSKVVLPTFILEPRSFLDKLSDYYYHSDILSE